jgi:Mg-chelatase subunit ChlD
VDTGSYTVGRRFLTDGNQPHPPSVRPEEYVKKIDPRYPDPTDGPRAVHVDGATTPFVQGPDHRLVRVGVQSRHISEAERLDASLTFVIDTSGSMDQEDRLELVKDSLQLLVENLRPTETIGIVTYGSEARVVLPPTPVSSADAIVAAIESLAPEGSTNAEAGLLLGYQQARAAFREGGINRVVLASDGVANVGTTGPDGILASIGAEARDGIHLVTLGFGMGNYNDVLMEQLANQGDGFYSYVDDYREAERLFTQDLVSTLQTLAEEAKIQVEWNPAAVSRYRLVGFENRALADTDFRNEAPGVEAGEIGAGHSVTALYEVQLAPPGTVVPDPTVPPPPPVDAPPCAPVVPDQQVYGQEIVPEDGIAPGQEIEPEIPCANEVATPPPRTPMSPDTLGMATLRWTDPETGTPEERAQPVERAAVEVDFADAAPHLRLAATVAAFAEVLRASPHATAYGLDEVASVTGAVAADLRDDEDVIELVALVRRARDLR